MRPCTFSSRRNGGFSYIEVLVAVGLLTVALVPAMNALQSGITGSTQHATNAADQHRLRAKLEEVLAKPFSSLYALTYASGGNSAATAHAALSDPVGPQRRLVYLYRSTGSALSSADTGLLHIAVAHENGGATLETLRGRWW